MQLFFHIRIYCYRDLARKAGIGTQLFLKGFPKPESLCSYLLKTQNPPHKHSTPSQYQSYAPKTGSPDTIPPPKSSPHHLPPHRSQEKQRLCPGSPRTLRHHVKQLPVRLTV